MYNTLYMYVCNSHILNNLYNFCLRIFYVLLDLSQKMCNSKCEVYYNIYYDRLQGLPDTLLYRTFYYIFCRHFKKIASSPEGVIY